MGSQVFAGETPDREFAKAIRAQHNLMPGGLTKSADGIHAVQGQRCSHGRSQLVVLAGGLMTACPLPIVHAAHIN